MNEEKKAEKVTPLQAMQILEKAGHKLTLSEAELILELLYKFANVALESLLSQIRNKEATEAEEG